MEGEAVARIRACFASASVSRFYVFFPDPWWKRRHHKRRLWTPEFAALLADRLVPGGEVFAQTDVRDYGEQILEILDATPGLENVVAPGTLTPWEGEVPPSPRERRYLRDATPYYQMRYRRR
jgi:tRNA (guanine-N7-)-methyltransferase